MRSPRLEFPRSRPGRRARPPRPGIPPLPLPEGLKRKEDIPPLDPPASQTAPPAPAAVPPVSPPLPPNRRGVHFLFWGALFAAAGLAVVVVANELKDDKTRAVSDEAPTVLVDPAWVTDDVFQWDGIEWVNVYGGCARGCTFSAVVAKTDACWRMATADGSLYLGQRLPSTSTLTAVSAMHGGKFVGDRRGHIVGAAETVVPAVAWKLLPGDWDKDGFVDSSGRHWRVHFLGAMDDFTVRPRGLHVAEVRTAGGVRLITKGGSFFLGPVAPVEPKPAPGPKPMDKVSPS